MVNAGPREAIYAKVFGPDCERFADPEGRPAIEVLRYTGAPVAGAPVCDVWVTSGMSDRAMQGTDGPLRRELIFYAPPRGDYVVPLRTVASYPFQNDTFLERGHTIQTFGTLFAPPRERLLATEEAPPIELPHLVLLAPLLRHHRRIREELTLEGCAVEFLWVVPISAAEHALKRKEGVDRLLELFEEQQHAWLFDPDRRSYVD